MIWNICVIVIFPYLTEYGIYILYHDLVIDAGVKNDHIIMSLYTFIFIVQQAYIHKNPFKSRRFNKTRFPKLFET